LAGLQLVESPDHRTATDRCDIADKSVPEPVIRLQHSHDFAAATLRMLKSEDHQQLSVSGGVLDLAFA
jgi:hypothetical protein